MNPVDFSHVNALREILQFRSNIELAGLYVDQITGSQKIDKYLGEKIKSKRCSKTGCYDRPYLIKIILYSIFRFYFRLIFSK